MNLRNTRSVISKGTKGKVLTNIVCYESNLKNDLTFFESTSAFAGDTFQISGFNIYQERIKVIICGSNGKIRLVEVPYNTLLSDCSLDISSTNAASIESILISYTERDVINMDKLRNILLYTGFCLVMLLVGTLF